ncbi:hypothetical protein OJAV_G00163420 [Oryzias javanicus]|uniref:Ig-like domain-containing protein n=1 Tax=Oryzias javanicus TaxID=123683 RepID=A0A437CKK5_ORYJA|nr:hypothetical protein OJAV_G00163420 [Oryzias javanicus]
MKVCARLVLVFWMTLSLLSAQEQDSVEVLYSSKTITAERGSTVTLSCVTRFSFLTCSDLHVSWHTSDQNIELTDSLNYFTTISEKIIGENVRERMVITDILRVTQGDSGRYQCKADCSGNIAMGHFIKVNVTEKSFD